MSLFVYTLFIMKISFICKLWHMYLLLIGIIPLCKHVVAKVTLVPCSVNLTGKGDTVGHGEVTINNARIIKKCQRKTLV